jgi:hypothetical protein
VEATPAVLRCEDGSRLSGDLQVISLTGGLLGLSRPLALGSQVKLMFVTRKGSVQGAAEMLCPVSRGLQPFRARSKALQLVRARVNFVCFQNFVDYAHGQPSLAKP